jgi:regulator of sirC expression with transglutaminase-like and TPR domain
VITPPPLPEVALFAHLCCRPEAELDLGQAALALAEPEYPGLDVAFYLSRLDRLAESAWPSVRGVRESASQAASLVAHLVNEEAFQGNTGAYEDPKNSFLNEVLDRRLGIPISLSVVMIEVARRLSVPLQGVSFPGHFLLRAGKLEETPLYLDPFGGKTLSKADLAALVQRGTGQRRDPRSDELQVATKTQILSRMLTNLRNIYTQQGDAWRVRLAVERQKVLEQGPRPPLRGTN